MKTTVEFNLPEDQVIFDMHLNADKLFSVIYNLKEHLKDLTHYSIETGYDWETLTYIQNQLTKSIEDHNLQKYFN